MSGLRLQRGRELAGLTPAQAAKLLGVDRLWLLDVEDGKREAGDRLVDFAKMYRTTTSWLLGDDVKISDDNKALLSKIKCTDDRVAVEEIIGLWSTPERDAAGKP